MRIRKKEIDKEIEKILGIRINPDYIIKLSKIKINPDVLMRTKKRKRGFK